MHGSDDKRIPEPSFGADEEGEVPIDPAPGVSPHGAWIGVDDARRREEAERRRDEGGEGPADRST